jgi:hypothetical protein
VQEQLERRGFRVGYIFPQMLIINWEQPVSRKSAGSSTLHTLESRSFSSEASLRDTPSQFEISSSNERGVRDAASRERSNAQSMEWLPELASLDSKDRMVPLPIHTRNLHKQIQMPMPEVATLQSVVRPRPRPQQQPRFQAHNNRCCSNNAAASPSHPLPRQLQLEATREAALPLRSRKAAKPLFETSASNMFVRSISELRPSGRFVLDLH